MKALTFKTLTFKTLTLKTLLLLSAMLLLASVWRLACGDAWHDWPERLTGGALAVAALAGLSAWSFRRLRSEDRVARLEAQQCREQGARSRADEAVDEADLLLARLTLGQPIGLQGANGGCAPRLDVQRAHIQAELTHLQQRASLDAACAGRLDDARTRLDQVARVLRSARHTAQAS